MGWYSRSFVDFEDDVFSGESKTSLFYLQIGIFYLIEGPKGVAGRILRHKSIGIWYGMKLQKFSLILKMMYFHESPKRHYFTFKWKNVYSIANRFFGKFDKTFVVSIIEVSEVFLWTWPWQSHSMHDNKDSLCDEKFCIRCFPSQLFVCLMGSCPLYPHSSNLLHLPTEW